MRPERRETGTTPQRRRRRRLTIVTALLLFAAAATGGYFLRGGPATRMFDASGRGADVVAVYFSGDMGLRFGMGQVVAEALGRHGIATLGKDSATLFHARRSQSEVDAIVSDAVEEAARRSPGRRIVLIGQSFGADILASALPNLPPRDRALIAATVLVVPANTAYFRADPLGIAYLGKPDAVPGPALRTVDWSPLACIQGALETDSLCPALRGAARVTVLPGGHFLRNDDHLLTTTILGTLDAMIPGAIQRADGDTRR